MTKRILCISGWYLVSTLLASAATNEPVPSAATNKSVTLFMPDGQVRSHLLRVFVTADIQPGDQPVIFLEQPGESPRSPGWIRQPIQPREVARFQRWAEMQDGVTMERTGTLLLFDLRGLKYTIKPCIRFTPVLKWGDPQRTAIGDRPVYLGNLIPAGLWSLIFVVVIAGVLARFAARTESTDKFPRGWKRLLLNPEGRLSLSKTQVAVWTFCIAWMVFCFGLMRMEVPAIPDQLVVLMGLSLATRATIFVTEQVNPNGKDDKPKDVEKLKGTEEKPKGTEEPKREDDKPKENGQPSKPAEVTPKVWDLIHSGEKVGNPVAITKAQMVLWTCVSVFLFCVKSLLNGELWEVPWQLVALMGISQASYVIPPAHKYSNRADASKRPGQGSGNAPGSAAQEGDHGNG